MSIKQAQVPDLSQYATNVPDLSQYSTRPAPTASNAFTPEAQQRFDQLTSSAVKEMQTSIRIFAYALSSHPVMAMQDGGRQERQRGSGSEYLGGTNPFGNFLVNQYANNAKVVGNQFVNIDLPEPLRSNTAQPNVNLKGIINTIGRIGTPGSENKPDGIWQARTNNALKQIYAVGMALIQFAKDMGISIKGFSDADMEQFKELIPASYTDLKSGDITERATSITKYINALTSLYQKFEKEILEHPEFKALISQEKAFANHSHLVKEDLNQDEQQFYEAHKDTVIPGVNINGKPVRLMDVVSSTAFNKFLQGANVDTGNSSEVKKYIATIKTALQGGDAGPGF